MKKGSIKIYVSMVLLIIIVAGFILMNLPKKDDGIIKVGYSADTLVIERWKRDRELFKQKAEAEGIQVIFHNANENNDTQVSQIKSLIEDDVDVLVIIPYDKDGISDVVNTAIDKGIKVISYDRLISNAPVDVYLSFDNYKVGESMASELLSETKGNYIIINGSPEDNNSSMFRDGYIETLQPFIDSNEVNVVKEVWADDWREAPAYEAVVDVLNEGTEVDAIIGANDHLADAAIRALSERGLAGKVFVAGHDADVSACQRIVEGTQHVTIYKPIDTIASEAVDIAIRLATGQSIESHDTIYNGYDVPYVKLDVISVTEDNILETVVKDGFHKYEDVFRE
ncbi:sugar ABC transporter substrate-binding protein [Acidaminobacter sp. JC074]|uniref:sugar ABC transporter substrate-binding protein n=1 Tax=Acidaminobacter sp. JC074 TaxID=2530199 RepID=UPI001F0E8AD3|nr:substrate-binding domain-containing protein [Acidaminobacter sp. JC074]